MAQQARTSPTGWTTSGLVIHHAAQRVISAIVVTGTGGGIIDRDLIMAKHRTRHHPRSRRESGILPRR